jgi:hypothetical protein
MNCIDAEHSRPVAHEHGRLLGSIGNFCIRDLRGALFILTTASSRESAIRTVPLGSMVSLDHRVRGDSGRVLSALDGVPKAQDSKCSRDWQSRDFVDRAGTLSRGHQDKLEHRSDDFRRAGAFDCSLDQPSILSKCPCVHSRSTITAAWSLMRDHG